MMNNLRIRKAITVFVIVVTTSGCSHWNELSRKHQGAAIGAGTGAVIGSIVGGPVGTVVGGASGALAGGVIAVETR
jgi:uncharacterized protein YcfJ